MKRLLFPALLMMIPLATALADPPDEDVLRPYFEGKRPWFFELDAGINMNLLTGNPVYRERNEFEGITNVFEQATGISPLVGLSAGYNLSSHVALVLRADYDPRWTSNSASMVDTCVFRDVSDPTLIVGRTPLSTQKEFGVDVDYLSISLLGRFTFRHLFIYAGPSFGIPIGGRTYETDRITDETANCSYDPTDTTSPMVTSGEINGAGAASLRIGARIGLGYQVELDRNWSLVPQIGFDFGLNNVYSDDQPMPLQTANGATTGVATINRGLHIHSIQATIGIQYQL